MRGESYPGFMREYDSIEVSADNLDATVERLIDLRQKMVKQVERAKTSSLKHEVFEAQQLAAIYNCGYESGIAVLDELIPIQGRSWKFEIEDLIKPED